MPTPEELAKEMQEASEIHRRATGQPSPYRAELVDLLRSVGNTENLVDLIVGRWKEEYLKPAVAHDKDKPNAGQDYENYSKPLIVPTEVLRARGSKDLAHRIYLHAVDATDNHCKETGSDLHRGALYADLAITFMEREQYQMGLSWLLAAANEDLRFNRITQLHDSYAMAPAGIFGEWVKDDVLPDIPAPVMDFVNAQLGTAYGFEQILELLRSLAGQGDLNLLAGILNFEHVRGRNDYVGHSVRFTCLRDLATLFEVLLKRIGKEHVDPAVKAKYTTGSPMLANMLYMMHYQHYPLTAANRHLHSEGLFRNSVQQRQDILDAIEAGHPTTKDFVANDMAAVRTYLDTNNLSVHANTDAIAKRLLLALRLRNETSHGFNPSDAGMLTHVEEFRIWLLQIIFYCYFWFRDTGQAAM